MSAFGPLEVQRRVSLFLSFAFAVVGFAVGLNALIKCVEAKMCTLVTDTLRQSKPKAILHQLASSPPWHY